MKILIVDDLAENLYMLEYLLKNSGYEVISASNGIDALQIAQKKIPDLIISDILMPGMDGFSFCRECKKDKRLNRIPFLFYTSTYTDPKDIDFALGLGADRFVIKPEDPIIFEGIIKDLLDEFREKKNEYPETKMTDDVVVLKEYNEALIRKLEDKMKESEEGEKKLRGYVKELEETLRERKKAEKALRVSEEKYRTIFENVQDVFFLINNDGTINDVSPSVKNFLGSTREELIGENINRFYYNPEERQHIVNDLNLHGKVKDYELKLKTKSGEIIYGSMNARAVYNSEGIPESIEGAIRDITKRKLAEDKIKILNRSIEQSPVSIVITDSEGKIEYVNPKFTDVTGYSFEEVFGKNPGFLSSGKTSPDIYRELWKTILERKEWHGEFHNKKKNGELYWDDSIINSVVNEKGIITHFVAVKEDVTEKKKMLNDLIAAKEKAEEMNRLKSSFLSNMSHELRTPLVSILGFSEILTYELENPSHIEMINSIYHSGKRLSDTLNLILDLSKIESNKFEIHLSSIDIDKVISKCTQVFMPDLIKKKLNLETVFNGKDIRANLDERLFEGVILNLLSNAVKYTPKGKIIIETGIEEALPVKMAYIKVKDTGIGIKKENLELIFEEFRQESEGFSRSFEGVGLGLTIAKKITELMNGAISVESTFGVGTTFTLRFPFSNNLTGELKEEEIKKAVESTGLEEKTGNKALPLILYVEDEPANRSVVNLFLKKEFRLNFAKDGSIAVNMLKEKKYDLFLMDINLGSAMSGTDVTKEIRKMPEYFNVPVIAVTAYAMMGDKEKLIEAGCSHYISKPFGKNELIKLINNALGK